MRNTRRLGESDIIQIKDLYDRSYPENFFDRRMLGTGKYFGYFEDGKLIAIAGIHVYSEKYRVAALGNITTDIESPWKVNSEEINQCALQRSFKNR